jgi:ABC-type arginine transport system permease subunit
MAGHVPSGRTGTFEEKKASIKSGDYHRAKGVRAEFLNGERIIMEEIIKYVKPELVVVAVVLYLLGQWIKQSQTIKDKYIPMINGAVGIVLCGVYVMSMCEVHTIQQIATAAFTAITQGILAAGLSTYVNQLIKQSGKTE